MLHPCNFYGGGAFFIPETGISPKLKGEIFMVNIELKGGVVKEFDDGITAMEVAKSLGMGLYKAACVCRIDGEVKDLRTQINKDCKLEILTFDDDDGKRALRHTASHVLAQAVKRLYPEAKLAIGPAIDNGFYYDFDVDVPFTPEVLEKIEAEMKKIVKEALPLERYELDPDEAIAMMEKKGEPYKVELIKEHAGKGEKISFFRQGEFDELNLSFTSINLPRLAIKANGDIDKFFTLLNNMMDLTIEQLTDRFAIQCQKKVRNYPFLMGQGVWLDSEGLGPDDSVAEVLKHGTLSVGFIGLAETLKALIGKHHGESAEAQELGLKIIQTMRDRTDLESKKTGLNFSVLATPAEGLSGRFVRMDRERYGVIPGVTDRDYYTNSFHVPVYYPIRAVDKIRLEAPYHALTNGGHISYVEMDGDPVQNVAAFEKVIRCMKEAGIGYGSVNHPVDRDPCCGFTGIIGDSCPQCGRTEHSGDVGFERIRRITGYLVGTLDRFNDAKRAEEHDRVKHAL